MVTILFVLKMPACNDIMSQKSWNITEDIINETHHTPLHLYRYYYCEYFDNDVKHGTLQ